ncbi:igE-binding protein-like [Rattus norvegicus]|uniref:igE-binding protein-like n=1 Tax=Rattus norvegicus TaxID=10116 RepID=UPI002FD7A0CE
MPLFGFSLAMEGLLLVFIVTVVFLLVVLKCEDIVKAGQNIQESMSETEQSEKLGARKKKKVTKTKVKEIQKAEEMPLEEKIGIPRRMKYKSSGEDTLYPLKESEALELTGSDSEQELSESEEEELEEEAARYEEERYGPRWRATVKKPKVINASVASTPPPYIEGKCEYSFCPPETQRALRQMFPVFEDDGVRSHQPLEHKQVKELAESVHVYGVTANFTMSQVERLASIAMTPADWQSVTKACLLSMGQYIEWKALWHDACQAQARANAAAGQPAWTFDMLTGQGQWANNQTAFPLEVYAQIAISAVKAWKALTNRGEVSGNLTKVIQGPSEPFSDFVARMMEAAGRIFGDQDQAMPLIEQLVFEQCTKECRNAILPWKSKGLQAWLKACREIGGPLTNTGLAAAILQGQRRPGLSSRGITCFQCGKPGHMKRECRNQNPGFNPKKAPGLCPKCKKGKHWANECRSVKDITGKPLDMSKKLQRGPRPQGPQIYGATSSPVTWAHQTSPGEPLRVPQD